MLASQALAACILMAANTYQIPAGVMTGIVQLEGGRVGQEAGPNIDGSYDLGPMQINTHWLPMLAQVWHVDAKMARVWVRDNGCVNVHVGAWVLRQKMSDAGSLWGGIAAYHSATPGLGTPYAHKIIAIMKRNAQTEQSTYLRSYTEYVQR